MAEGSRQAAVAYGVLSQFLLLAHLVAIYGVLMGYAMLFPDSVLTLIFPPVSLKAKWFVVIFAVIELFTGIKSISSIGGGIAHFAHLGGMLFGWLLILYWKKRAPDVLMRSDEQESYRGYHQQGADACSGGIACAVVSVGVRESCEGLVHDASRVAVLPRLPHLMFFCFSGP